jgi:hypothetical protein
VVGIISRPLVLYLDNEPTFFYPSTTKSSVAASHINIKYHVVKDRIEDQTIYVKHISTTCMLAYPLTKILPSIIFREHVASMGLLEAL